MKNIFFVLSLILGLTVITKADQWLLPEKTKYCSENKKYCIKVEPKKLESQLSYFQDKVDEKENAGADRRVKDNYCKGTFYAKGKKLWKIPLVNEVAPVSALVSDNGDYVVLFDNWHNVGYGDDAVTIYDGASGRLIKKLGLTDFLTESDFSELPRSTSSIQWHGIHQIDYEKNRLILKVVKPSKNDDQFFDVHIDLKTGAVLDPAVDRIPYRQFFISLSEGEEAEPKFPVKEDSNPCAAQSNSLQISPTEIKNRILEKEFPKYPAAAKAVGAGGVSVFDVFVSESGDVACVKPISGHPLLRATIINALKKWKFEKSPTSYTGKILIEGKSVLMQNGRVVE
ncbi:MAG TPA: energy transducer TonB [Pyrinomonadaceae bacterium]|jgi:hypothetical protein